MTNRDVTRTKIHGVRDRERERQREKKRERDGKIDRDCSYKRYLKPVLVSSPSIAVQL